MLGRRRGCEGGGDEWRGVHEARLTLYTDWSLKQYHLLSEKDLKKMSRHGTVCVGAQGRGGVAQCVCGCSGQRGRGTVLCGCSGQRGRGTV